MTQATITMTLPHLYIPTTRTITPNGHVPLALMLADTIRAYAARKGVSPRAVEYAVNVGSR